MTNRVYFALIISSALTFFYQTPVFAVCLSGAANPNAYQKRVVVTALPLLRQHQSKWGGFGQMDVRIPQLIAADINQSGKQVALDYSHVDLKSLDLPGQRYGDEFYRTGISLAELGLPESQFVLTGVIENIAATSDKAYSWKRRYFQRIASVFNPKDHKVRRFSLILELVDVYRGELVWQQQFVRHGNWNQKRDEIVELDNPVFWQTGYGKKVKSALAEATNALQEALACQPLMARIDLVQGDELSVADFTARQLETGAGLQLFKQVDSRLRLVDGAAEVVKVAPQAGKIEVNGDLHWNVRAGDLLSFN